MKSTAKNDRQFWLMSGLIHVILFAIVLMTPASEIIFRSDKKDKPEIIRRGEELNEVVEDIRDLAVERLKSQVALLDAGQDRMATNFDTLNEFYQPFADAQRATARIRFTDEVKDAKERMKILITRLEAAQKDPNDANIDAMATAINENMARLLTTHDEVKRSILLRAGEDTELQDMQQEAFELQLETNKFYSWTLHEANTSQRLVKTIAENKEKLPAAEKQLAHATSQVKSLQKRMDEAKKDQKNNEEAKRKHDGNRRKLDGKIRKTEGTIRSRKSALNKIKKEKADDTEAIATAQESVDNALADIAELKKQRDVAIASSKKAHTNINAAKKHYNDSRNQQRKEQNLERTAKREVDSLKKSLITDEPKLLESINKRNYCIGKSVELQRSVDEKLAIIVDRFLKLLDKEMAEELEANPPGTN